MPEVRQDALLRKEDLLYIENTLYETKKEELAARQIARVNSNYPAYAEEIGYQWYSREGSAKILAAGASAKDVPFVDENGGTNTAKVYTIATGLRYKKSERMAYQAKNAQGKGPSVNIDTLRVGVARRFVAEKENDLFFNGDSKYSIKGLLNHTGINTAVVTGTDASSKKWANKTAKLILEDLLAGVSKVEEDGWFKAKILIISPQSMNTLRKPYSDENPMTVLKWLMEQGMYFERIVTSRRMRSANNALKKECFAILDNNPEVIELALPQDIELGQPEYDILMNSEQAITERTAGCIIRHPSAIYVGTGI